MKIHTMSLQNAWNTVIHVHFNTAITILSFNEVVFFQEILFLPNIMYNDLFVLLKGEIFNFQVKKKKIFPFKFHYASLHEITGINALKEKITK